jgi:hypothetical protein
MRSILELFTQDTDAISKVFPITFYRSTKLWFHSLKPDFIPNLHDLYIELISNLAQEFFPKKSIIELFVVTQREDESIKVYL